MSTTLTTKFSRPRSYDSDTVGDDPRQPFLPVLIIPGFMSSGLSIKKSTYKQGWEGKRIWLNLVSLGFESIHMGKTNQTFSKKQESSSVDADIEEEATVMRSMWLQHMTLQPNMLSERDGVEVRNLDGLAGVDYLTPGALTNHLSYVFGPVIQALQKVGYVQGLNLDAAPYDWRLPPSTLEERDRYFTRTMAQVENMYAKNKNTPVVLLCHSLGCKMGHYFLNFAKMTRGQAWIDKHIHTYMPVGAPHLGATKALRSIVSGDKMSLDAFLSDSEALALGRSFGSGPFLVPTDLPKDATPVVYLRAEGAIEISIRPKIDTDVLLAKRLNEHKPGKLKLTVVFDGNGVSTPYAPIMEDLSVSFGEKFTFRTPPEGPPPKAALAIMLCEPGVSRARKSDTRIRRWHMCCRSRFFSVWNCNCVWIRYLGFLSHSNPLYILKLITCWWLVWNIIRYGIEIGFKIAFGLYYIVFWFLLEGTVLTADELSKVSGGSFAMASGRIRSVAEVLKDDNHVEVEVDLVSRRDRFRWYTCCIEKRKTPVIVSIKWISPKHIICSKKCSHVCQQSPLDDARRIRGMVHVKHDHVRYVSRPGFDLLAREGQRSTISTVQKVYDRDPLDPRGMSSYDAPPVRLIKAVYGTNLPTEVGAVYRRHKAVVDRADRVLNLYFVDKDARLSSPVDGYVVEDGIVKETKETPQVIKSSRVNGKRANKSVATSGDGTVPYWSLQHVRTWGDKCNVSIEELDGAEHREILADKRLHEILINLACSTQTEVEYAV